METACDPARHQIRGKATHVTFGAPSGFANYFIAEFEQPFESVDLKGEGKMVTGAIHLAKVKASKSVAMRIGTSFKRARNLLASANEALLVG